MDGDGNAGFKRLLEGVECDERRERRANERSKSDEAEA